MKRIFPSGISTRAVRTALSAFCAAAALLCTTAMSGPPGNEPAARQVPFPEGFRQWVHVKSGVIGPEFPMYESEGGIHHVYANQKALSGFQKGNFEDGSILVYDLVSLSTKSGVGVEGARRRIDAMVKDRKLYSDSGGLGIRQVHG
ncbi:MAG TPA: cytochrome P460 family protein [Terracidiphilus sp.]